MLQRGLCSERHDMLPCCCDKLQDSKQFGEERVDFSLLGYSQSIMEESQGRNLAGGSDAETGGTVPADLFPLPRAQLVFFQPRNTSHSGPSSATSINNQENVAPDTATGRSDLGSSSVETPPY